MNKRLLGGLLAAGIVGGGVYGFAATFQPTSDNLGGGGDTVASCDAAIDVAYTSTYSAAGYVVSTVELSNVASSCDGQDFQITLSNLADAALGDELTGTFGDTGSESVAVSTAVLAKDVAGIDIVVTG